MDLENLSTDTIPLWVKFPNLHFSLWNPRSLSKMGSYLGAPIKTEKLTAVKVKLEYPRILAEMKVSESLPRFVPIEGPCGMLKQPVIYEWKPVRCSHCKSIGHDRDECSKITAEGATETAASQGSIQEASEQEQSSVLPPVSVEKQLSPTKRVIATNSKALTNERVSRKEAGKQPIPAEGQPQAVESIAVVRVPAEVPTKNAFQALSDVAVEIS